MSPCNDGGPSYREYDIMRDNIENLTALLCEALTAWGGEMPLALQLWKRHHDDDDRKRLERQQLERAESIARLERQQRQIADELARLK